MKEQLGRGLISKDDVDEVVGRCNAISNLLSLEYEDLVEGARDDAKY